MCRGFFIEVLANLPGVLIFVGFAMIVVAIIRMCLRDSFFRDESDLYNKVFDSWFKCLLVVGIIILSVGFIFPSKEFTQSLFGVENTLNKSSKRTRASIEKAIRDSDNEFRKLY